jgi:hypothetical protein
VGELLGSSSKSSILSVRMEFWSASKVIFRKLCHTRIFCLWVAVALEFDRSYTLEFLSRENIFDLEPWGWGQKIEVSEQMSSWKRVLLELGLF